VKIIKTWLMNIIKFIFQAQFKNLMCSTVLFAMENNFSCKFINVIVSIFNTFSLKTKFHYVEAFEKSENAHGTVLYFTQDTLCASKPQYYYQNLPLTEFEIQNYVVLKLDSAKIIGSSNVVVTSSGKAIYDQFSHEDCNKYDYTDTGIYKYVDKRFLLKYIDSKKVIQCGIMLSGNYSGNYYHFIYEFLTKFLLLDKLNLPKNIPIIVDEIVGHVPQYQELLQYFNNDNREIIFITDGNSYEVEILYYLPLLNLIPPNFIDEIRFNDCQFNLSSIAFLRDTLLPKMVVTSSKKRIFLSRRNASTRRSYNESDVVKIFEKYDFEVVYPEAYTIAEQIYLFNNADFISGVSGAAFTNILFCNQGCKILCMNSAQNELSVFSTIAKHLGLDFQYLSAHEAPYKAHCLHEEFVIDPAKVEKVLVGFLRV
jgi:capsular polysaccharide biosynthesis protein